MVDLSLHELKLVAKNRDIKDYENKSKGELIKILNKPESKINCLKQRIKEIREEFNELRDRFSKPKIKWIRRSLYEIENKIYFSTPKIKEIERNLLELKESLFRPKKYYDYHDKYKEIRDVESLFNLSVDRDCYKPIRTNSAFSNNYIEYETKGDKNKTLLVIEYLRMIRTYLGDIIKTIKLTENGKFIQVIQ